MKTKVLNSLTLSANRAHFNEHDKYGMKRVDLEENQFTQKCHSELLMKRITGLDTQASSDTQFECKTRAYGPLTQRLDVKNSVVSYMNLVG